MSGALYAAVYVAQRAMYRNGLRAEVGGEVLRGEPADGAVLLLQGSAYYGGTLAIFALYGWLLVLCRRGVLGSGRARLLAIGFPVLFNAGLLFGLPYEGIDAFTYVLHGYIGNLPANPYVRAPFVMGETAIGRELAPYGWLPVHGPSPYGPLWTRVEIFLYGVSEGFAGSVAGALLLLKAAVVAASLGSAALVWAILGRVVSPERRLLGTLVYLWNPVLIVEFAAEGHNDALMILFVLASLACAVRARPGSAARDPGTPSGSAREERPEFSALSVAALFLGVLVKYVPLIFVPAQAFFFWRTRRSLPLLAAGLFAGLLVSAGLAIALYGPLWAGARTFAGVFAQSAPSATPTPSGLLYAGLSGAFPQETAARLASGTLALLLAAFALAAAWRVRDAAGLLGACAATALFYALVASNGYWPWYAALPLALLALVPRGIFLPTAVALALCSRLAAPVNNMWTNGFVGVGIAQDITTGVGVTAPLGVLTALLVMRWGRDRPDRGAGPVGDEKS